MNASGEGVTVAVIDSGVNPDVSDLTGSVITGPDLTGLSTPSSNPHWGEHGTWMASIIAGHGHDGGGSGIEGVAPDAKILSIRVIPDKDDPGYAKYDSEPEQTIQDSLATGIRTAVKDGAKVISMSIGYSAPSGAVRAAVQYAYDHDVVLVASSGNSGLDDERRDHGFAPVSFPAEYPGVIGVGALYRNGTAANFSSNNLSVKVAAPGQAVPAQGRDGLYWTVDGTSPACALVAGVAALIESRYPVITPAQVTEALTSTASNGSGGYNAADRVRHGGRGRGAARGRKAARRAPGGLAGGGVGALRRWHRGGAGGARVAARRRGSRAVLRPGAPGAGPDAGRGLETQAATPATRGQRGTARIARAAEAAQARVRSQARRHRVSRQRLPGRRIPQHGVPGAGQRLRQRG